MAESLGTRAGRENGLEQLEEAYAHPKAKEIIAVGFVI